MFAGGFILLPVALAYGAGIPKETYLGALHRCASQEKVIPTPSQLKNVDISNGQAIWLRFYRQNKFRWQTNDMPVVREIDDTWENKNEKSCGVYHYEQDSFEATTCSQSLHFLCELPDCSKCPYGVIRCVEFGNSTYFYHTESKSWSDAQVHCQSHDVSGLLSVNNNKTFLQSIFIILDQNEQNIGKVWVGFNRIGWETGDPKKSEEELNLVTWENEEPSNAGKCILAIKSGNRFRMRVADCEEHHGVSCVSASRVTNSTSANTPASKNGAFSNQGQEEEYPRFSIPGNQATPALDYIKPSTIEPKPFGTEGYQLGSNLMIVTVTLICLVILIILGFLIAFAWWKRKNLKCVSSCCLNTKGKYEWKKTDDPAEHLSLTNTPANSSQDKQPTCTTDSSSVEVKVSDGD